MSGSFIFYFVAYPFRLNGFLMINCGQITLESTDQIKTGQSHDSRNASFSQNKPHKVLFLGYMYKLTTQIFIHTLCERSMADKYIFLNSASFLRMSLPVRSLIQFQYTECLYLCRSYRVINLPEAKFNKRSGDLDSIFLFCLILLKLFKINDLWTSMRERSLLG